MSANTNYALAVCTDTAENSKYLAVGFDSTATTHAGNSFQHILPSTWGLYDVANTDTPFYIYGLLNSAGGGATPRRIGIGSWF